VIYTQDQIVVPVTQILVATLKLQLSGDGHDSPFTVGQFAH